MPPGKRRISKEEKAVAQLAKMLSKLGIQDLPTVIPEQDPEREAEAVLQFLEAPKTFRARECKREICHNMFSSNYRAVAYCSNACRALDLAAEGIKWDPYKNPEERWGGEPPLIIGPEAMQFLLEAAARTQTENVSEAENSSQNQTETLSSPPSVFSVQVTSPDALLLASPEDTVSTAKNLEELNQEIRSRETAPQEKENTSFQKEYSVFQFQSGHPTLHIGHRPAPL